MKKHLETISGLLRSVLLATITAAIIFGPTSAIAADNFATWNVAGATQPQSNTVTLFSVDVTGLSLQKRAFLNSDNTPVANTSTLPTGTLVDFVIYVDNTTGQAVSDVNISDTLDALFAFQTGTLLVYNGTGSGTTDATIYSDLRTSGSAQTDANDTTAGEFTGIAGTVVSAGRLGGNNQVDLTIGNVWAMMFTVQLQ